MRIHEIASGEKEKLVYSSTEKYRDLKYLEMINRDCSDAVSAMRRVDKLLFRGIRKPTSSQYKGSSRENRNTHTNNEMAAKLSEYMTAAGITATRLNSMPTTSDYSVSDVFGHPYVIFPINGFEFSWSPIIKDFGMFARKYKSAQDLEERVYLLSNSDPKAFVLNNLEYTNQDFAAALKRGNEIGIRGEYYAFDSYEYKEIFLDYLL